MLNKKALAATAAGPETDDEFNQTVLLLHGDGTNGAQNNTFLDSGTANSGSGFTITRNGNTTQGTFSPFSQTGWSNYFDGTGDYLQTPSTAELDFETGDFTIEFWMYPTVAQVAYAGVMAQSTDSDPSWFVQYNDTGTKLRLTTWSDNVLVSASNILINTWTHIAMVRSGSSTNNVKLYINGVQDYQSTYTADIGRTDSLIIGGGYSGGGRPKFQGYLSNIRIVKGRAVYTSAFTPPTAPLGTTTGGSNPPQGSETKLLTCQSNRFIDNSSNAFTLTVNGNPSVQAFSPFAPTDAYSAATNGGSGYFDGSGDTLTVADTAAIRLGSSDFCVEAWVYPTSNPGFNIVMTKRVNGGDYGTFILTLNSGTFSAYASSTGSSWNVLSNASIGTATLNSWQHVAFYRSGSNWYGALNGVVTTLATGASYTLTNNTSAPFVIGGDTNDNYWNGYISSDRLVIGSAVYGASNFTPPTAPLTAVTNTQLLCNFTNAGIIDQTAKNVLETVGNAQIDTTTKKFGTGSMEFDGSGDRLLLPASPNLQLGSGDFTIECWAYRNSNASANSTILQMSNGTDSYSLLFGYGSSTLVVYISSNNSSWDIANGQTLGAISNDTWYHFALTRSGSNFYTFKDGVQQATWTSSASIYQAQNQVCVGFAQNTHQWGGYIDDLRITKGVARYTANFTAPTKAFADQ